MNATQAGNLRVLIAHMETNVTRTLSMNLVHECGTPCCAMGEACMIPQLADQGLAFGNGLWDLALNGVHHGFLYGAKEVFGVTDDEGLRIFGSPSNNVWGRKHVTPQEWALEARKVLSENGYGMDEAKPIPSVAERLEAIYKGDVLTEQERQVAIVSAHLD